MVRSLNRLLLIALLLVASALGGGLLSALTAAPVPSLAQTMPAQTMPPQTMPAQPSGTAYVTTDAVPERYQLGQQLYLESCASCHLALPPAVLPTETWRDVLRDRSHYGTMLPRIPDATLRVMGQYLKFFSRAKSPQEEQIPYRVANSLYFKALHPGVSFAKAGIKPGLNSCEVCHPASRQFNFRQIKSES
jgi:cytochrome c5